MPVIAYNLQIGTMIIIASFSIFYDNMMHLLCWVKLKMAIETKNSIVEYKTKFVFHLIRPDRRVTHK